MENTPFNLKQFDKAVLEGNATWWEMELPSGNVTFGDTKTDMLGYSPDNFKHYKDFTDLVHPDDYEKIMKDMRDHLEGKKGLYETTYRIKTNSGEYIRFYDCGKIIKKEGENITLMGFVLKIEDSSDVEEDMKDFRELILQGNPSVLDLVSNIK